jgi:hypothetical protein
VDDIKALLRKVMQGFEATQKRLSIINLREAISLASGCNSLQPQDSQDVTHCSNKTPSATLFFLVAYLE